ncbi:MAG: dihydropteroate synthase [Sulfurospirillum sp.]|nr:dihydropteroate synthase [Sulfurospirillum sp.]
MNYLKNKVKIMGVLNANEDSFYASSRFNANNAIAKIEQMIADGADIIDIGGVSSRPGSVGVRCEEELERIKPIVESIYEHRLFEKVDFSLDTYSPLCAQFGLDRGFTIINDITALNNDALAKIIKSYDASVVLMHMQGKPSYMQSNPHYENILTELDAFFDERIAKAKRFGIEKIILDVGIGFGKTLEHNLALLKYQAHFLHFGYELLVGASRKSMIDAIIPTPIEQRLAGTLAIHLVAVKEGASIVRVHDVKEHVQALSVQEAIGRVSLS